MSLINKLLSFAAVRCDISLFGFESTY